MLFYIRCPTCSRVISSNLDQYHEDVKAILNDPKKTKKQKEKDYASLLDKYHFKSICCRIRIMGLIPYHEIIQS